MSNTYTITKAKKGDAILLLDSTGIIVGIFSTEAEAEQAKPIIDYNLQRGKVPARLLKSVPQHRYRTNNKQVSNKNRQNQQRSK